MPHDTTSNKEIRFPLTNLNEQLLAFVRIANTMIEANDLEQILSSITREVGRVIDFDRSSVAFLTPGKDALILRSIHKGSDKEEKFGDGREIPINKDSVIGWVAIHNQPFVRLDIRDHGQFEEVVTEEPLRSDMVVPLTLRGELIGTLNVGSYRPYAFSDNDLEVLQNCASFASLAIEHTLLRLEAQELSRRYKVLLETANDIIMTVDRNTGRLIEVNRKCQSVLGYTKRELLDRSYFDLFAQEDQYLARRDFINVLSEKERAFLDRRMIGRDGAVIYVDINANLIKFKDDLFIQMIAHNVSQRRMLEQQIIHQNKNLQEVNRKLTQVDRMKSEFLANISHELRTPLSIIIAYTESLKDPDLSAKNRDTFLEVIEENGEQLLMLINNLLDLSKLEISARRLTMSLSHIHDVIRSVWPQLERRAKDKGVRLTLKPGGNLPVMYLDNTQLLQVVTCLIQNAVKFTDHGGSVTVRTGSRRGEIYMSVKDTGPGIRTDKLSTIFETFQQLDGSSSRKWGGMGIGLALAKHIVELHKGRLSVESEYGEGSTFTVALPVDTEEQFLHGTTKADRTPEDGETAAAAEPAGGADEH
ncbi:MAG: ATP-binding protein [Candidatus Krumholzibacteriia bacterium]